MDSSIIIRPEAADEHERVEEMLRRAFYNLYCPGSEEAYLAHVLRGHADFVPELDLVIEVAGTIRGAIMYTEAQVRSAEGVDVRALTLGPVAIDPAFQRRGLGKQLMERSFQIARELGYQVIVLFGSPMNYVARGFVSCRKLHVQAEGGVYPAAMMVKELEEGVLAQGTWEYRGSEGMQIDSNAAQAYDAQFPPMPKEWRPSQEEFYILSKAVLPR